MARLLLIFILLFVCQLNRTNAQVTYINSACGNTSNTTNLDEQNKLLYQFFLTNVSSKASIVKFYNVAMVDFPNTLYVLYQCRADLSLANCMVCVDDAIHKILQACPINDEAIVWYVQCVFRYAYRDIISSNEISPYYIIYNDSVPNNIPDLASIRARNMDGVIKAAEMVSNGGHFAERETKLTSLETLYSFAQCTSDLDGFQCQSCLKSALDHISGCCNSNFRATAFLPSCLLGYNILVGEESLAPSLSMSHDRGSRTTNKGAWKATVTFAITCLASFGLVLLVITGLWLCLCQENLDDSFEQMSKSIAGWRHGATHDIGGSDLLQFDLAVVKSSTCNFSWKNKLGEGGFGEVYKGIFQNGEEIAVKRLLGNSQQGAFEFKNEVLLLAKLQHKNLVKLLGFCISEEENILIFEFLPNSSLDRFLYDPLKRVSLEWEQRFKIITGVARGLLYLHEDSRLKIIHRDLKASNILLDEAMNAKIADFGLAKLFESDESTYKTMRIAGTYGYMAPEYLLAGHFSVKSDVYSFGVIVLEIVSGQKNRFFNRDEDEGLLHCTWRLWKEDAVLELVDPLLRHIYSIEEVKLCIQIGLLCIQEDATYRPTMASVVAALNGQSITLPLPHAPYFFTIGSATDATSSNRSLLLRNDVHNFMPRYYNGEYTGTKHITELCPR